MIIVFFQDRSARTAKVRKDLSILALWVLLYAHGFSCDFGGDIRISGKNAISHFFDYCIDSSDVKAVKGFEYLVTNIKVPSDRL